MDLSLVAQMLGVIVQSYAGILAIGSAFFVFLIQQYNSKLKDLDNEIIRDMKLYVHQIGSSPTRLMKFQNEVLEGDNSVQEWIKQFTHVKINFESYEFQQIMKLVDERKLLDRKRELVPNSLFGSYLAVCIGVFFFSLTLLASLNY